MRRAAAAGAVVLLCVAGTGCAPRPDEAVPFPDCPTYREVSGVYVMDGVGPRPCLIHQSDPGPTLRAQDYGITWRPPSHTSRTGDGMPATRPPLSH